MRLESSETERDFVRLEGSRLSTTNPQPARLEIDSIKAHYANGVLEIEIPKQTRVEPKRITVTVN